MKQLLQSLKDGSTELADVPPPKLAPGKNLIETSTTLVSVGTERMLLQFGKGSLYYKARSQPEKVKMFLEKARTDGVFATIDAVRSKLDQPLALGYCNVGIILNSSGRNFSLGDRVVSNGCHAEIVSISDNLCAKIPDNVSDEAAAFTVIAAIGLQGIRLANPTLGETVVVIGLGLIGLLTVQMLRAQGCRVLGVDFDAKRLELAQSFGAETCNLGSGEDVVAKAEAFSDGLGIDAVIITAATASNEPVSQAARMCRKRGRIVLVGVVGLELNRSEFYEKELTFQVSCSYGPGRYDINYEEKGHDYPLGFVRWTEKRNFEAVLYMMSTGAINVDTLITHRFDISEASKAMELLTSNETALGILLRFSPGISAGDIERKISLREDPGAYRSNSQGKLGVLGAGNYSSRVLIPAFKAAGANLECLVSNGGVSAVHYGKKFGFREALTDDDEIFERADIDTVVIATRHNNHARQVIMGLNAQKHVFCEKPLCLTIQELSDIEAKSTENPAMHLMVGFNRRFAPLVIKIKELISNIKEPKTIIITVNAGEIPADHWTQDPLVGGGRMIGEGCHFIDLARFLADSPIISHHVQSFGKHSGVNIRDDKLSVHLTFENGSFSSIHYLANGHKSFPKERIEIFTAGRVLQLDNFRFLRGWGWPKFRSMRLWRQNKGQIACAAAFIEAVRGRKPAPIPKQEIFEISKVAIEVAGAVDR